MESLDLPSRLEAVALAGCGFAPLVPRWRRNGQTGVMRLGWSLKNNARGAQALIQQANSQDAATSLRSAAPEHPYLIGLYYQEILAALESWLATGTAPIVMRSDPKSRLLRLLPDLPVRRPHNLIPVVWWGAEKQPAAWIVSPVHAAIAVLCGFVPCPVLHESEGRRCFAFAAESLTFPGLTLNELARATKESVIAPYAAGNHPACYAVVAAFHVDDFAKAEALAERNPTHMLKGSGKHTALMSEAFLRPDAPARYRDRLRIHLAAG